MKRWMKDRDITWVDVVLLSSGVAIVILAGLMAWVTYS